MEQIYINAVELEEKKFFSSAYEKFQQCLKLDIGERGEILFHCGWCVEMQFGNTSEEALVYYTEGADASLKIACRMNCYFRAGWIFMHLKNYSKAAENFFNSRVIGIENQQINSIYSDATYWLAICLEAQNYYLDALKLYQEVQSENASTAMECRWREICCLNQIGNYEQALEQCNRFYSSSRSELDGDRFKELIELIEKEKEILNQLIII